MSLEVVEFKIEHLDLIRQKSVFHCKELLREKLVKLMTLPYCHIATIVDGDNPFAILGLINHRPGFGEVWSVVSEDVKQKPIAFHKAVLALMDFYEDYLSISRLQIDVKEDFIEGISWAESLGFECEGLMKHYDSDGSSHYLFARVKQNG
jgi:hypothetical protein